MKKAGQVIMTALVSGVLVIVPVYLAILLLLKGMQSVAGLTRPVAMLLPSWVPAETVVSLILVLVACIFVGAAVRTSTGRAIQARIERVFFERIPGYALFRSLTQRLAGQGEANVWKPALAEIEDALVPAFIIEEFDDGRFTVFVPSIPTPLAGAVYILDRARVHPLDEAVKAVSRWGAGAKDLVAAMEGRQHVIAAVPARGPGIR
jgi:uncharacterized membrane protein